MSSPLAANIVDAAALADELARYRVVDSARLAELLAEFIGHGPVALAEYLIGRGTLTVFQAERALAGESRLLALGPYRLTGLAGRGTFGPLFRAVHVSKPGEFALRVLPLRSLWKARQAKQLARTLSVGVNHPAIVPLVEVDSANGFHFLVWPHVEGTRLADHVADAGPLPPGEVAAMLGHLANGLAMCHARRTMHGAITPHSVVFMGNGFPRLLELGAGTLLAQNVADDESLFDSMSSALASGNVLTFAAPELASDPHSLTSEADQYALGALGYFAVTGLPPYPQQTLAELLRAKRAEPPPSAAVVNPVVPVELAAILERMMSPAAADRFAALEVVEQELTAMVAAGPAPVSEPIPVLSLSQIQDARRQNGAISWKETGASTPRPAQRDDSDASVQFDLPEASETVPNALAEQPAATPAVSHRSDEPPTRATTETPPGFPLPTRATLPPPILASSTSGQHASGAERVSEGTNETEKPAASDPRLTAPVPVQWHTSRAENDLPERVAEDAPPANSVLWKKVKRNLMFWQDATDVIQVSVFGPTATPGQTVKLLVFLHTPDATANARTLARAFLHDAELIGTGYLTREVARASELAVHLSVANAGVAKALHKFAWRGQPHRLGFDLHVPWESPEGTSPGLVSVGLDNVRVGKIEFRLNVLPRKA